MPKEVIHIQSFNAGILGGIDEHDVPPDAFAYSENLNPAAIQGKLSGIEADRTVITSAAYDAVVGGVSGAAGVSVAANYEAGDSVVGLDPVEGSVFEVTDIDGTPAITQLDAAPTTAGTPMAAVSDGSAVHLGMGLSTTPQWVGDIDYDQFGGAVPGKSIAEDTLRRAFLGGTVTSITFPSNTPETSADDRVFESGVTYYYAVVFQYDGYQEGPIAQDFQGGSAAVGSFVGGGYSDVTVRVTIKDNDAEWNSRISGIVLYRGQTTGASTSKWPPAEMGYIDTIKIDDAAWTGSLGARVFDYTDSAAVEGESYSSRNGVSAVQFDMDLQWEFSAASEQYHFAAGVTTNLDGRNFDEAQRSVFRSQPYKFSMWDKRDFVLLPVRPVAIAAFAGRLYAFSENRTWVIDGTTLNIESEIHGIGTFDNDSVVATDRGLFFCDRNNIYITDTEGRVTPIGNPVLKNDVDQRAAYLSRTTATNPVVVYDSLYDAYVVAYENSAGTISFLMYRPQQAQTIDLPRGRWDHVLTTYTQLGARISANLRHPVLVLDGAMVEIFGSTTKRPWTATMRKFHDSAYAKYYHARILGDNVTAEYSEDGGSFIAATLSPDGGGSFKAPINSKTGRAWSRVRTHQMRLSGGANDEVDALSITRRRMQQT
ncbi:MAG: hypothetical protein R3268_00110 [Acidiferrobacterales bacterium]|nr:hypothetical protein [Acidiferrobacterales bacterium]